MKKFVVVAAGLLLVVGCGKTEQGSSQGASPDAAQALAPDVQYGTAETTLEAFVKAGGKAVPANAPEVAAVQSPGSRPSPAFDAALGPVLTEYHIIRRQLAADSVVGVAEAAGRLKTALEKVRTAELPGGSEADNEATRKALAELEAAAGSLSAGPELREARQQFAQLTTPMLYLVAFHYHVPAAEQPYVYYCPMRELAWLQEVKAMGNPYYGSEMLTCGVVVPREDRSRQRP